MIVKEYNKRQINRSTPEKYEELIKKLKKEHEKPVKGIFEFVDAQGGYLEFSYRFFKDDLIMSFKIFHGESVELPMGVVKHLNNTMKKIRTPSNSIDENGKIPTFTKTSRVRFTPLDVI